MNHAEITFNGVKIKGYWRDKADESVWAEIFKWGEYFRAEEAIKASKNVILDIGAHAGFFALYCRALNKNVKIICVEPEPENVKMLKKHLEENKINNVEIEASALAPESGQRDLFISRDSHSHYLLTTEENSEEKITVDCLSLHDLCKKYKIGKIDLLKIDIEGSEYELFNAWESEEWGKIDNIIMEYHDLKKLKHAELKQILKENGFSVEEYPSQFDKTMGFFFARNKKADL